MNNYFKRIEWEDGIGKISRADFELNLYINDTDMVSNTIINVYSEPGIYALIDYCKKNGWQAFDTGFGEMLDLNRPEKNGYQNFQAYLNQVLNAGEDPA